MRVTRSSALIVVVAMAAVAPRSVAQQAQHIHRLTGTLTPCRVEGVSEPALCGRREAYENREARAGRTISLNVLVLPATADGVVSRFQSTPTCASIPRLQSWNDLDEIRRWLGYDVLNLSGASYGTSAAATYIRRYPSRVRTVVMHGVVPLDIPMQVDLAQSAQQALNTVVARCEGDRSCRVEFPSLRADLATALGGFAASAGSGGLPNAGQRFREALNAALASAETIRGIPTLTRNARRGELPCGHTAAALHGSLGVAIIVT